MSALRYIALPLLVSAALLGGCGKNYSDSSKVLATVNGENITEQDYNNYSQLRRSAQPPAAEDKDKERKIILDEMIDRTLLAQHGASLGLEKSPDVHFRLKRAREQALAQEVFRSEVRKRYDEKTSGANKTEYKVRHILVKSEDDAKKIAKQLQGGGNFEQIAKARSIDTESGKRGGEVGWVSQISGLVPEFIAGVVALEKGKTSEPVKSQFGYHIIKVDDTRPLEVPTFDQALTDPRMQGFLMVLQQESQGDLQKTLDEIKSKAKITVN